MRTTYHRMSDSHIVARPYPALCAGVGRWGAGGVELVVWWVLASHSPGMLLWQEAELSWSESPKLRRVQM